MILFCLAVLCGRRTLRRGASSLPVVIVGGAGAGLLL